MAKSKNPMLEVAVLEAVGKIMQEISRFHPADRVYVARALLRNTDFMKLFGKAQVIGPYPRPLSPEGTADAE